MEPTTPRRARAAIACAAATTLIAGVLVAGAHPALAAPAAISIDDPAAAGALHAGVVTLRGSVSAGSPSETTSVLYVLDASNSTQSSPGTDCTGDGAATAEDDLNGDGTVGDILDCEIAAVRSLNAGLAGPTAGILQVGLVAFADEAAAADLSPDGTATFLPPGFSGGDAQPRVVTAARSVTRRNIALYDPKSLGGSGSGSAFNNAVTTSLSTLAAQPAGPKWVMFLTDGQAPVADSTIDALRASGVRLRGFGIGPSASCGPFSALTALSAATGESCLLVSNPAGAGAGVTGSQPDSISGVTVTVGGTAVAADVDPIGGWRAAFSMGAGSYTAKASAALSSGQTVTAQRSFSVLDSASGPAPGVVTAGPGSLLATQVLVHRPRPMRGALPSRVTGLVGLPGAKIRVTSRLNGARVLLQGRAAAGSRWATVDRGTAKAGKFVLKWHPKPAVKHLRVRLLSHGGLAGSAAAVPVAKIRACAVTRTAQHWSATCKTTARSGVRARLLDDGTVVDRAKVRRGTVTVRATGRPAGHLLVLSPATGPRLRLRF